MELVSHRRLLLYLFAAALAFTPLSSRGSYGPFKSRMESNMWFLIALTKAGCVRVLNPDSRAQVSVRFMDKYAPLLVQWLGEDYALVAVQPPSHSAHGLSCVFTCQGTTAGTAICTRVVFEYAAGNLIESLTFDRELVLPDGSRVQRGVPISMEAAMRALRLTARSVAADPGDGLIVKKLAEKTSLKKPGADGFKSVQKIRGHAPTAYADFQGVGNITIGSFDPEDTNRMFHSFACHPEGIRGRNSDRYATVFMLEPDLGLTRPVARFNARIRNGRVKFVYKAWFPNPQEVLVDQASYDASRMVLKTNRPVIGVTFSGVHFAIDGETHTVDDVPVLLKTKKSGAKMRSVKLLNAPE